MDYNVIADRLDYINDQVDELKEYINKNKDGTDFMEGMIKAYNMVSKW